MPRPRKFRRVCCLPEVEKVESTSFVVVLKNYVVVRDVLKIDVVYLLEKMKIKLIRAARISLIKYISAAFIKYNCNKILLII